jgi:hypothetical protein
MKERFIVDKLESGLCPATGAGIKEKTHCLGRTVFEMNSEVGSAKVVKMKPI